MRAPITLRNCGLILMVLCILWIPSRVSSSENKVTPIYDPRDIEQRFEDWLAQYGREYELETNGSWWAFSAVAAVEGINKIKTGKLVSLSAQELMECDVSSDTQGCEGGDMKIAFQYIKQIGGITTENDYPYKGKDGACQKKVVTKQYLPIMRIDNKLQLPSNLSLLQLTLVILNFNSIPVESSVAPVGINSTMERQQLVMVNLGVENSGL
uniref:Peptidase C1A papain C-terminal domain-containing protein n=1 Tax=Populus alba TaxID=43335 RepID=A0A4U5QLU8_POPAL|nr:hypothetical protein D5086_0000070060 [Populus alba]